MEAKQNTKETENKKSLKIISWNVNGIRAIMRKNFYDFLEKNNPDILCLQETKAHPEQVNGTLKAHQYHSYWHSAKRKGYSGVSVFTKIKPNKIVRGMPIEKFNDEGRMLELHFDNFILLNIYFPNGKRNQERLEYKMEYYHEHLKYVENLRSKFNKKIIVCGDYNTAHKEIDLARPKANEKISGFLPIERTWIDEYIKKDYIDTFREFHPHKSSEYTWWSMRTRARTRNVGWRIDYFFITKELRSKLKDAFIMQKVLGSDHCPIGIEINN